MFEANNAILDRHGQRAASSRLDPDLISAYLDTDYVVLQGALQASLRIGKSPVGDSEIVQLIAKASNAFLTAWNPFGEVKSDEENQKGNQKLYEQLTANCSTVLSGKGCGSDGDWPPEESFLALDILFENAMALAERFSQNAFVWSEEGKSAHLVLMK